MVGRDPGEGHLGDTGRLRGHQAQPWSQGSFPGGRKNLMSKGGAHAKDTVGAQASSPPPALLPSCWGWWVSPFSSQGRRRPMCKARVTWWGHQDPGGVLRALSSTPFTASSGPCGAVPAGSQGAHLQPRPPLDGSGGQVKVPELSVPGAVLQNGNLSWKPSQFGVSSPAPLSRPQTYHCPPAALPPAPPTTSPGESARPPSPGGRGGRRTRVKKSQCQITKPQP